MFTKVTLTSKTGIPLSLSNEFELAFVFKERILLASDSQSVECLVDKYSKFGPWFKWADTKEKLVFKKSDFWGNVSYLKIDKTSSLKDVTSDDLINELISRGYKVTKI